MSKVIIYHNPKCSKSRKALEILNSKELDLEVREYLLHGLSGEEVLSLSKMLELPIKDFIRKKEAQYKALSIDWSDIDQAKMALMDNPQILERPIVVKDQKAIIARPPEDLEKLF